MRRCQDGRLTRQLPFPTDPDHIERTLSKALFGLGFDVTLLYRRDPAALLKDRRWMMGTLSKHFHIAPSYWADKPVQEMGEWFGDMIELAAKERASLETGDR